jgi:phosphoserine phosphatase RsbU/P
MDKNHTHMKKHLFHFIMSGIVFFIITMPFRTFFSVMAVTEVRPASALPPVFGLLFGFWGALGAAIANLIADIMSGYSPQLYITGFIAQFLYGYIPYKLWYATPFSHETEMEKPRLDIVRHVVKFIIIIILDSIIMAALFGFLVELYGLSTYLSMSTLMVFFNNLVFSIVLGIPIFIYLTMKKHVIVLPNTTNHEILKQLSLFFDVSFVISLFIMVLYAIFSAMGYRVSNLYFTIPAFIFIIAYVCKPIRGTIKTEENNSLSMSLNEKLILVFLLIGAALAVLTGFIALLESANTVESLIDRWNRIYLYVSIDISIFYIITIVILWYAEKKITIPIGELAKMANNYVDKKKDAIDSKKIVEQCLKYSNDTTETGCLARSFMTMTEDIQNYIDNITKVTAEKERIGAELNVATQIQADMLPRIFPAFPNRSEFDLYASMDPAKEVGGDFYDFFMIDDDHLAIIIADVSGKGVPASLFMVISKTLLKNHLQNGNSPEEAFINTNNELCEGNDTMMFVTAWLGVLTISSGEFVYVNAGHNPPLYRKSGGQYEWLNCKPGVMLATLPGMKFVQYNLQFSKGDSIFLYTDGITEAINVLEEEYGENRLYDYMNNTNQNPLNETLLGLRDDIKLFVGEADQFDDITMLLLRYNP